MKYLASTVLLVSLLVTHAHAGDCFVRRQAVVGHHAQAFRFVPFAVTQQTLVLQVQQPNVFYSYSANSYNQPGPSSIDALADLLAEKLSLRQNARALNAVGPYQRLRKNCAKCHSGPDATGGFSVDGEITPEVRLKAFGRIMHEDDAKRMPPEKDGHAPLSAGDRSLLLQEISK